MKTPEWFKISVYALSIAYASFCKYFHLDELVFAVILSTMLFDWVTGTIRAALGRGQEKYSSTRGNNGIIVKVLGAGAILLVSLFLKIMNIPYYEYFTTSALSILAANDLLSSLSNIYTIRTGQKLQEIDAISLLIRSMHGAIKKVVNNVVNKLKNISE